MSLTAPQWRSFRRRHTQITVDDLRRLCDPSLPGRRPYGGSQNDRLYVVAKVDIETDEPIYPCRPSERRKVSRTGGYRIKQEVVDAVTLHLKRVEEREAWRKYQEYLIRFKAVEKPRTFNKRFSAQERHLVRNISRRISRRAGKQSGAGKDNWEPIKHWVWQEFLCRDEIKWTYPTGRFTTWLRTKEIAHALTHGRLVKCHEALISVVYVEHKRLWQKLRNEVFRRYGHTCMRCGRTTGEMHVDHVKPWAKFPEQRYDSDNLQVLCRECHTWKEDQGTEMDFRPQARTVQRAAGPVD